MSPDISLVASLIFRTRRGKIVWSTAYSVFVPCGLKIGDATSLKMYYILSTSEAQELHPASWQAQKHIPCVHGSPGILSLVRSLVLSGLVSCITLQPPSLLWSPFMQYVTSFSWSNLIGAPPTWRLEQKSNRQLTRLFFPSACEK